MANKYHRLHLNEFNTPSPTLSSSLLPLVEPVPISYAAESSNSTYSKSANMSSSSSSFSPWTGSSTRLPTAENSDPFNPIYDRRSASPPATSHSSTRGLSPVLEQSNHPYPQGNYASNHYLSGLSREFYLPPNQAPMQVRRVEKVNEGLVVRLAAEAAFL